MYAGFDSKDLDRIGRKELRAGLDSKDLDVHMSDSSLGVPIQGIGGKSLIQVFFLDDNSESFFQSLKAPLTCIFETVHTFYEIDEGKSVM